MSEHRSRLCGNIVSILKSRMIMKAVDEFLDEIEQAPTFSDFQTTTTREEIVFSRYMVNAQKDFRMAIGESFKLAAVQAYAENKG